METVELERATLGYPGRTVLRDVSFALAAGEFVGVLGPNGAGKTTLLRAILGLVRPGSGSVRVMGRAARAGNGAIGYMPQARTGLAGGRIVGWEFVASAAGGAGWGLPFLSREARREAGRALALVGAEGLADRTLGALSGGERQRLLLAQAVLGRPQVLLLDEPLLSLDPRRQQEVVALADGLRRELGLTVLFSAHELAPLLGTMDRVLYLGGGSAAIGAVDEVVTGPVLSRLYGTAMEVVRASGRVFVVAAGG